MTFCKVSSYQLKMIRGYPPPWLGTGVDMKSTGGGIDISNFDKNLT